MSAHANGAPASKPRARGGIAEALGVTLLANHYPALHGLRVLAIVSVVQWHVTALFLRGELASPGPGWTFSHGIWFGMDLFFLLSGFLIGSMLLVDAGPGRRVAVGRFYVRRAFRIMPPYLVVLTLLAVAFPLNDDQRHNLWREYAYLTNYVPPLFGRVVMSWGWSLALEEHFYLVVPVLVLALRAIRSQNAQLAILAALWASAPVLRIWVFLTHGPWDFFRMSTVFYVQSHLRYDILVAGIFTACVQRYYGDALRERLGSWPSRWALGTMSAVAIGLLAFTGDAQRTVLPYNLLCWGTLTTLAYVPLVLLLLNRTSALSRLLSHRFFAYSAALGYGIYLVHIPVIDRVLIPLATYAIRVLHAPASSVWALALGLALGLSAVGGYLLHVLVEKPALRLRDRLTS